MNKEEFLSVYERQQVWLPCHQEKDFGKTLGNLFEKYAEYMGGSILILLGIKILIEHLFF